MHAVTPRYVSKRKPRVMQKKALEALRGHNVFGLRMAQRTGKTKVIIDEWAESVTQGEMRDLMVIAPGGAYLTWADAIPLEIPDKMLRNIRIYVWTSGLSTIKRGEQDIKSFFNYKGPRILLMNVEALSSVDQARAFSCHFLDQSPGKNTLIIDESVIIKNHKTKRTKFVLDYLAERATRRRILSGLLTPKSPLDLYSQFWFLDPDILRFRSFDSFRDRYAKVVKVNMPGARWPVPIIKGWQNLEELKERIAPYTFCATLKDCYDLPASTYMIRDVEMTPDQKRMYNEMKKFAVAKIKKAKHVSASLVITQMLRLHQILCGHVTDESGVTHHIKENRTKELLSLLEDYEGKAIIWCRYDNDVRKVSEALAKHFECKVARFWGGNTDTREDEERVFKSDDDCLYMVATPSSGRYARTWDNASLVVYYSNSHDLDHRAQSEERPKNVGKKDPIAYVDLVCRGTVDEGILESLRSKISLSSLITESNWEKWVV